MSTAAFCKRNRVGRPITATNCSLVGIQGLFAAVLRAVERDRRGVLAESEEAAVVGTDLLKAKGELLDRLLSDVIAEMAITLPALANWQSPDHEVQRGWRVAATDLSSDAIEEVADNSIYVLLALLARGVNDYPYAAFELDSAYFDPDEVHLLSFRNAAQSDWVGMTVREWANWLCVKWGVGRHLRVALRKLRGERRDTFRIRPLEDHLQVVEVPPPAFTVPRLGRALQILRDLGLMEGQKAVVTTATGRQELERILG